MKNFKKTLVLLFAIVMFMNPLLADSINNELFVFQTLYNSMKYMEEGKSKVAFIEFLESKVKLELKKTEVKIDKYTDAEFAKLIGDNKITKEMWMNQVESMMNKAIKDYEKTVKNMTNLEVQELIKSMVASMSKNYKKRGIKDFATRTWDNIQVKWYNDWKWKVRKVRNGLGMIIGLPLLLIMAPFTDVPLFNK